ncbi:MAG: dihydroxyacetone kinase subunit DhaK [Faecalicoccus sp.]|uniref:dihydroxyacetone kinase subunit DhaK n=1 Tax=Faecalicoccus sp. TaxID=1971758 RepID=UPI002F95BFD3
MQRFYNDPDLIVDDMLKGYVKAHQDLVHISEDNDHVVVTNNKIEGKVGLVSGGGSGHEPCFLGYIGKNMLDAVAVGEIFSSPPATAFLQAFKEADTGAGVVCLFGNYAGDNMNVKMAVQMAAMQGIIVKCVVATDDIASSPKGQESNRHGIAGNALVWKMAGALASQGASLDEVIDIAQKTVDATRSMCVGLSACSIPSVGHSNFVIEDGTIEYGIGHHGEPGIKIEKMQSSKDIAFHMAGLLENDLELNEDDEVVVMVSGMGATPIMEQYVLFDSISDYLNSKNIKIIKAFVGNYVTSLEMNGIGVTITKFDDQMKELLKVPVKTTGLVI